MGEDLILIIQKGRSSEVILFWASGFQIKFCYFFYIIDNAVEMTYKLDVRAWYSLKVEIIPNWLLNDKGEHGKNTLWRWPPPISTLMLPWFLYGTTPCEYLVGIAVLIYLILNFVFVFDNVDFSLLFFDDEA